MIPQLGESARENLISKVSLLKWLVLGLEQGIFKVSLEHLLVPPNREVLKTI
jgi:hypothetical protein